MIKSWRHAVIGNSAHYRRHHTTLVAAVAATYVARMTMQIDYDALDQVLSLGTDHYYIQVRVTATELKQLADVRNTNWTPRRTLAIGTCLGHGVHWCMDDDDVVRVLVGSDDETWELAISLPLATIDEVIDLLGY